MRARRTLVRKRAAVSAGTHTLRIRVPAGAGGGAATLRLALTDAAGNTRTVTRTHLPRTG
jgi:hypothetical protein